MSSSFKFACPTPESTQNLAAAIGSVLHGGELIEFTSDLGGGKTAFVKGLARGMGVKTLVQSPTFIISQIHRAHKDMELHHFDFYRLDDPGIMRAELAESLTQPNAVVALEWGGVVHDILPPERLGVAITVPEAETRVIKITCPKSYSHVLNCLNSYQQKKGLA